MKLCDYQTEKITENDIEINKKVIILQNKVSFFKLWNYLLKTKGDFMHHGLPMFEVN